MRFTISHALWALAVPNVLLVRGKVALTAQVARIVFKMPAAVLDEIGIVLPKLKTNSPELHEGFLKFPAIALRCSVWPPKNAGWREL